MVITLDLFPTLQDRGGREKLPGGSYQVSEGSSQLRVVPVPKTTYRQYLHASSVLQYNRSRMQLKIVNSDMRMVAIMAIAIIAIAIAVRIINIVILFMDVSQELRSA